MTSKILVTGAAGFIGSHVARQLLQVEAGDSGGGPTVVGVDNLDDYYDPALKRARLERLVGEPNFEFERLDLRESDRVLELFEHHDFDRVIHLAAQPGVRASAEMPGRAVTNNVNGFLSVLEGCRHHGVDHLVYASSSSVYGPYAAQDAPLSEDQSVDHPVSLYAATKVSNEAMAHAYADCYGLPVTGLRFFTVYGPWGRPDMAYFLFTDRILNGESIDVYNYGDMERDFTYIDDIVEGILRVAGRPPVSDDSWDPGAPDPSRSRAPYRLYNIGRSEPVGLMDFIGAIEEAVGRQAELNLCEMPPGDVKSTYADVSDLAAEFDYRPSTDLREGVGAFVEWYLRYYGRERALAV